MFICEKGRLMRLWIVVVCSIAIITLAFFLNSFTGYTEDVIYESSVAEVNVVAFDYTIPVKSKMNTIPLNVEKLTTEKTKEEIEEQRKASLINGIVNDIISDCMSDHDKVMAIQTYIHENATYDDSYLDLFRDHKDNPEYILLRIEAVHDPYVIFEGDGLVVCTAYSKAFEILAQRAGLEVGLIKGDVGFTGRNNHIWNKVEVDGSWYHIDVTHNSLKKHKNFLHSDDEMRRDRSW